VGFLTTTTSVDIRDWVHLLFFATLIAALLTLVGILAYQLQQAGRLGWAGFFTAFVGTAVMLMERREHLFSPDFGVKTPRGLLELIVASFIFGIGYVLQSTAIARDVLPRGAGYCSPLASRSTRSRPRLESWPWRSLARCW
jgi:uncharacterized membrane protein YedE/YeeE